MIIYAVTDGTDLPVYIMIAFYVTDAVLILGISERGPTPPLHLEKGANRNFCGPLLLTEFSQNIWVL